MTSRYPYLIAAVAAVSGLLFGFDTAVINGALIFLREELDLTTKGTEIATSSLLVGCAVGAGFAGMLTDRFGRKRLLIVSALLFALSAVGAAIPRVSASSWPPVSSAGSPSAWPRSSPPSTSPRSPPVRSAAGWSPSTRWRSSPGSSSPI